MSKDKDEAQDKSPEKDEEAKPPPEEPQDEPMSDPQNPEIMADLYRQESGELEQDVIEIAARDVERSSFHEARLAQQKAFKRETFYSDLIYTLTHLRYEEQEARVLWVNMLTHKMDISESLGRNVGIRVAALDYFKNIIGALDDVKIIDASSYIETAQLAVTDPLTGIFNHRYFQDRLLRDINRAKEEGGYVSLLMIDIDYFKQYNDINGHIAGDVALKEVAAVLRRNLKRDDLVARYGGEEFAVILVGLDRQAAKGVAERICTVVKEMDFPNEKVLPGGNLTISIGLAECPGDAEERGDLIESADRALYVAKRAGKNRVALSMSDQRREERFPLTVEVQMRPSTDNETEKEETYLKAKTENLSLSGLCMLTGSSIAEGQLLYLCFDRLTGTRPLLARVVWETAQPDGLNKVGLKFVNIDSEDTKRLRKLIGS